MRHFQTTLLSVFLCCRLAQAGGADVDQARAIFNAGAQAYEKGDYAAALDAFEAAYRVSPRPGILFSMAQAHRRQYVVTRDPVHLTKAVELYRDYLAKVTQGERRGDAVQALVELEPLAAREHTEGAAPAAPAALISRTRLMVSVEGDSAEISLDGQRPQGAPLIADVSPGRHVIRASAPGYVDERREVVAVEGALVAVDLPLREQPGSIVVQAPSGAEIFVDRRLLGKTPLGGPLSVPPGRRSIWIAKSGWEPRELVVNVARGKSTTIRVPLARTTPHVVADVLLVASGVAAAGGAVFTGLALANQAEAKDVERVQSTRNISPGEVSDYDDAKQRRDAFRIGAFSAFGSAFALAATGFVLYVSDRPPSAPVRDERPEPERTKTRQELGFVPVWGPALSGLSVRGRF